MVSFFSKYKKYLVFIIPILVCIFFGYKYVILNNDHLLVEMINNDQRIYYHNVRVYPIEFIGQLSMHINSQELTLFNRVFEVYRDPPDSTDPLLNRKIVGFVNWDLKIIIIGEWRADGLFT